jgi:hypothetical protein
MKPVKEAAKVDPIEAAGTYRFGNIEMLPDGCIESNVHD